MVKVNNFFFGNITINGKKFDNDIIVYWDGEIQERRSSHEFKKSEFIDVVMKKPEVLIIGIGTANMVKVSPEVELEAKIQGIELVMKKTPDAIAEFNKLIGKKKVVAMFHLTC